MSDPPNRDPALLAEQFNPWVMVRFKVRVAESD